MFVIRKLELAKFNLIGHSMGGAVATLIAGTFPEIVSRLIVIEALGPFTKQPAQMPTALRESLEKVSSKKRVFPSIEEAAKRRSEGNLVDKLPLHAARILCSRGLRPTEDDSDEKGFVWASDPKLLTTSAWRLLHC
eukprot:c5390_g1_i2.p1 GENE.c5390_g1_i2~~c5390_g1_i2.p1  ORF type:complete len:136 (+),score=29.47 c5390_g1_i2:397-804(+)